MKYLLFTLATTLLLCSCSKDDGSASNSDPDSTSITTSETLTPPTWLLGTWVAGDYNPSIGAWDMMLEAKPSHLYWYVIGSPANVYNPTGAVGMPQAAVKEVVKTETSYSLMLGTTKWYMFTKLSGSKISVTIGGSPTVFTLTKR